jgi:hypothetical protein
MQVASKPQEVLNDLREKITQMLGKQGRTAVPVQPVYADEALLGLLQACTPLCALCGVFMLSIFKEDTDSRHDHVCAEQRTREGCRGAQPRAACGLAMPRMLAQC